jgi:hypothetical protein
MWYRHCDELDGYGLHPQLTAQQYFQTYRWWLKREYQHNQRQTQRT